MRDYKAELENRIQFVRDLLKKTGAKGIIFGNSGGKDSALVGIICKMACENTVGIIMPCASKQNYGSDTDDANAVAKKFGIENRTVDLTTAREEIIKGASAFAWQRSTPLASPRAGSWPERATAARHTWATLRSGATEPTTST